MREMRLQDEQILEILGRKPVHQDIESLRNFAQGKTILITGGAGSIGSDLVRLLTTLECKQIIVVDWWENGIFYLQQDVKSENLVFEIADIKTRKIDKLFAKYHPDIVFHASAYKHVPLMQDNALEAFNNNVWGTLNVMQSAIKHGSTDFVLVSSDKAVNPTNVMGATKRLCEILMLNLSDNVPVKFNAVRFGNVIQSNGSVINTFWKQLAADQPLTVTDPDIQRYFMTTREATELIVLSASVAQNGEIFLLDMGEPVKIIDLAEGLLDHFNKDNGVEIIGLRPGEKMYEELDYNPETMSKTVEERIFAVKKDTEIDSEKTMQAVQSIVGDSLNYAMSDQEIKDFLKYLGFNIQ